MLGGIYTRHPLKKVYPGYLKRDRRVIFKRLLYIGLISTFSVFLLASAGALTYKVKNGDTVYAISQSFNVSAEQIIRANNLEDSLIQVGQDLVIPHDFYVVGRGEGLYAVSRKSGVPLMTLLTVNSLTINDILYPNMRIRIPVDPAKQQVHVVQQGDSWEVLEQLYGLSEKQIRRFSGLQNGTQLAVGMQLMLQEGMISEHLVLEGETLYSLALRYGVSVDQLMQYNALNTDVIRAGQKLKLNNPIIDNISSTPLEEAPKNAANQGVDLPLINPSEIKYAYLQPQALYFKRPPTERVQPSAHYAEPQIATVESDYRDAYDLYYNFKKDVAGLAKISNALEGYRIMLDPGHGGYDPGAIGSVYINNKYYYLVEDEYVYDIALRLYALLVQHGAQVELTILAPNHTIRENTDLESFVNQKNEVYNDEQESRRPVGGRWGLRKRVEITQKFLQGHDKKKGIFMSLHADSGDVKGLVLTTSKPSAASLRLANKTLEHFGQGRVIRDDYLVLQNNPAGAAVLVEVRTMSQEEAIYLLDPKHRQADAQRLADIILAYAKENE